MTRFTQPHLDATTQLISPGAPFELEQREINGHTLTAYKNAEPNLRVFMSAGRQFAEKLLAEYQGQQLSFDDYFNAMDRLTAALQHQFGISKGDRVAIAMRNRPEWMIAYGAIIHLGAIAVPLNSWGKGEELQQGLDDSGAALAICDRDRFQHLLSVNSDLPCVVVEGEPDDNCSAHWLDLVSTDPDVSAQLPELAPEDPAMIMFTSGTSGRPKGALFSHLNCCQALYNYEFIGAATYLTNTEVMNRQLASPTPSKLLVAMPLFHVSGLFSQFLVNLRFGRATHLMYKWSTEEALRLLREGGITQLVGAPAMMQQLLSHPDAHADDFASVMNASAGGAATPEVLHDLYRKQTANALTGGGWGMTETGGTGVAVTGIYSHERPNAAGFASPVVEFSFRDEDGNEVPEGEAGEIWLKSVTCIERYWSGDEKGESFVDGWYRTGDVGYFSDEALLYICGRVKDVVIRGGENVYPAEIEHCLLELPGCIEAAVVGLPDEDWGESVAAVIVANRALTEADVISHCQTHLAGYKVPTRICFSNTPLPRNATNKPLKGKIREQYFGVS